jgi:hypothetical protein
MFNTGCTMEQFMCNNGQCIPSGWECDLFTDCSDNSDEHEECPGEFCQEISIVKFELITRWPH